MTHAIALLIPTGFRFDNPQGMEHPELRSLLRIENEPRESWGIVEITQINIANFRGVGEKWELGGFETRWLGDGRIRQEGVSRNEIAAKRMLLCSIRAVRHVRHTNETTLTLVLDGGIKNKRLLVSQRLHTEE
ncbi:hypothetical protein WN48_10479 [Eufriesea mexicana]|uniref:Uncharacterized protein n=1 Tax=Eufriesea mexicana TaxID=516756 RepID=A0A310SGC3_9HYME|nr:hypothetical protein WN48_10479 [Eufriesea mexicana]